MHPSPRIACAVFFATLCAHGTATSAEVKFEEHTADGALKRYRTPPPTDSNIASMLAALK